MNKPIPWTLIKGLLASLLLASAAQAQASGTEYVSFWSGDLRIIADQDDTEVLLIEVDTGLPLSMLDPRIAGSNFGTNPFTLGESESFEAVGGLGPATAEIRVRIIASDASGGGADRPIIVWTGQLQPSTRHPAQPPAPGNPWASYLPALASGGGSLGRELGREFLGFTTSEMLLFAAKGGSPTSITITDLVTNTDADSDDTHVLTGASPTLVYADTELEVYSVTGFEDDTVRISSNVDVSILVGYSLLDSSDWSISPPSYAAGDEGIELGTLFYTMASRELTVFPTQDGTSVTITDLSDGDDTVSVFLNEGDTFGNYDLYTPTLQSSSSGLIVPRLASPAVTLMSNALNAFDNDFVKVTSDKPVLILAGPAGSDTREFADVSFSVATGPDARIVYTFAQNFGSSNDFQMFAFDSDTEVTITSLSTTDGFRGNGQHDFTISPGVGGPGQWLEGTIGGDVWWGSGDWNAELLRVESTKPITVIAGDYDQAHFGAFIPFVRSTPTLPPTAIASADRIAVCPDEVVNLNGSSSFDQDSVPGPGVTSYEWDFDTSLDSDLDTIPDNDVDASGATTTVSYPNSGTYTVQLTFTDDEGESDTDFVTIRVEDGEAPFVDCPGNITVDAAPGECSAMVNFTVNADDNCDLDVDVTCAPLAGSIFPGGTTVVSCTATDDAGNASMCQFEVTVNGASDPEIKCPDNIAVSAPEGSCSAIVEFSVTAEDPCDGSLEVICDPASGSAFGVGTTTVCCTATDLDNNDVECCFDVIVADTTAPTIDCPDDIVVLPGTGIIEPGGSGSRSAKSPDLKKFCKCFQVPDGSGKRGKSGKNDRGGSGSGSGSRSLVCQAVVEFEVTADDNCGIASIECVPPSGSVFEFGVTEVTCTATDINGNSSQCVFEVEVALPPGTCKEQGGSASH